MTRVEGSRGVVAQRRAFRWRACRSVAGRRDVVGAAVAHGAALFCVLWSSVAGGQVSPPAPAEETPPAAGPDAPPSAAPLLETPDAPSASAPLDEPMPEDVPAAEDVPASGEVSEVIVTVDRRRKDLQDYSGTASAFSESQLRNIGVSNVAALSQVVPGLQIGENNAGAIVYIRGIGSDNTTELGDPAVAVHVDNVYLPRFRGVGAAFLDVERVEVNSGPQGTIRGRNATGGSINIISKAAVLGEFQTMAEITYGSYRQTRYQGMLNLPIGDKVALRVAGMANHMDPTWDNAGPLDHLPGAQDMNEYAGKAQLRIKPSSRLDITIAGDYNLQRSLGWVGANMIGLLNNQNDNGTPQDLSDDFLDPIDPDSVDDPRRVYQRGRYPSAETEHWGARLNVNYDTGPVLIELLASYRYLDWRLFTGANAGYFIDPADLPGQEWDAWSAAQQQNNDSASLVGELRFASPDDQRLVWSLGLFGFHEDQGAFQGQITGDPDGGFNEFNMPSTIGWSLAAYGDATFNVTDRLRVLGGLRVTREHKDRFGGLWMLGSGLPQEGLALCARANADGECVEFGLASNDIGRYGTEGFRYKGLSRENYAVPDANATNEDRVNFFLDGIESFGDRDQTAIALCNDPEPQVQISADPAVGATTVNPGRLIQDENGNFRCANGIRQSILASDTQFTSARPQNGERDDSYVDFRVGVEYDLAADNLLYATVSSGHKAGGFNDSIPDPNRPGDYLTPGYAPETVYALEIGSKNLLADRKLRLNASAFAYRYDGLQFQTIITVGSAPPLNADGTVAIDPSTGQPYPDNRGSAAARQNAQNTAVSYGLDLDAVYALPLGLEVDLHALLMDARFPDGTLVNDGRLGLGSANAQVDLGGYWLPRVSPYTLNYSLSQLIFTSIGSFDWIIQGQTRGKHYMTPYNGDGTRFAPRGPGWGTDLNTGAPAPIEVDNNQQYGVISRNLQRLNDEVAPYTTINLGVGWRRTDGLLSIRGFVNNVFDVAYATNIQSSSGTHLRFYNDPRMAGVRVRLDF